MAVDRDKNYISFFSPTFLFLILGSTVSSYDRIPSVSSSDSANHLNSPRLRSNTADVIGVADGVGGWRAYGVDPGLFSMNLMKSCERLGTIHILRNHF